MMWNFSVVEGSLVVGRGGIKGQFTLDQVNTVSVQAVCEDAHYIRNVTIPAVPSFLVTAFEILNKNDVGVPDLGDKDEAFRKAGNLGRQKKFWEDTKKVVQEGSFDVSGALSMTDIGCLVKRFLRELKYPFVDVGSRIYTDLLAEMKQMTPILEFDAERYPLAGTLVFVTTNLKMMASRGSARMTIENLGILFAPSFVRSTNSKLNVDYSKDSPAVAVTKYLIEISPTTVFRSDRDFRSTSLPPKTARQTGRSRSVIKRILGFVRAKSQDRDEPVVRGLNRMATPLASNRVSGVPSDLPSSSRRSRSIIRRASYLSPYLNTPANKPPSLALNATPLSRWSRLQEQKSLFSRDYHRGGSDMKSSKRVMEEKNILEDTFEEEILSDKIVVPDVDIAHRSDNRISKEDLLSPVGNRACCVDAEREGAHEHAHPSKAMENLHLENRKDLVHSIGSHHDPFLLPSVSALSAIFDSKKAVAFRDYGNSATARPSLEEMRRDQTVQKTRTMFENSSMLPNPISKPSNDYSENDEENNNAGKLQPSEGRQLSK